MPNKIIRKQESSDSVATLDRKDPIKKTRRETLYDLEHAEDPYLNQKASCMDVFKQIFKSSRSRGPCFWFSLCFGLLILILIIIALIVYFALWVGMPDTKVVGVIPPKSTSDAVIDLGNGQRPASLTLKIGVQVMVNNPNRMDLSFSPALISAYPETLPDLKVGESELDMQFHKESNELFTIPFTIQYSFSDDPNSFLPKELIAACTVPQGKTKPEQQLNFNIKLDLKLKITDVIKIPLPTISYPASFDCPLAGDQTFNVDGQQVNLANLDFAALQKGVLAFAPSAAPAVANAAPAVASASQ